MGRKKKKIEEPTFIPSKYQEAIFDFIANKNGDLLIEAVAGSGKTTTIIEALKLIPQDKKVLFCAFNKDIVKVLTKKTKPFSNTEVKTIHGLGYKICINNFEKIHREPNMNKYWQILNEDTSRFTDNNKTSIGGFGVWLKYQKNVLRLFDLARLNLAKNIDDIIKINERYNIPIIDDEYAVAYKLMQWGSENIESMDYTDMVWYPNIFNLDLSSANFDYIFVDEAQDLSKAQREFILKCGNEKTRYVFVGDSNQSIYGFSAADPESFKELRKIPNITNLPLSVCYRCPKSVITLVNKLVPNIQAEDDAIDGEILKEIPLTSVNDQDMVLCRYNAPLFNVYSKFMKEGKKAFIMGKDIGKNLIDVIKSTQQSVLNTDLEDKGVFSSLLKDYFDRCKTLMKTYGWSKEICYNDVILTNMRDNISALLTIATDDNIKTSAQLIDKISKIFNDNITEGIILSTIHKAKGLEANNVYILNCKESKRILQDWEKEQERNLLYVACTRAKKKLAFIDAENLWNGEGVNVDENYLERVEKKVEELYSNENKSNPIRLKSIFPDVGKRLSETPRLTNSESLNGWFGTKKKKRTIFK